MTGPFKWASATRVGPSHLSGGLPCQDAVAVKAFSDPDGQSWISAALADGAGFAPNATDGAQYAADCFVQFLEDVVTELGCADHDLAALVKRGAALVRKTLQHVAANNKKTPLDYSATFLGCLSNGTDTALIQIGDGCVLFGAPGDWHLAFEPQHGEFVNEAFFITQDDALDRLECRVLEATPDVILLTSDGLEDCLVDPATFDVHPPLLNYLVNAFRATKHFGTCPVISDQLDVLLASPTVTERTDDDTSIVALSVGAIS